MLLKGHFLTINEWKIKKIELKDLNNILLMKLLCHNQYIKINIYLKRAEQK